MRKRFLGRGPKVGQGTKSNVTETLAAFLVTLAILIVIELPSSSFFSPVRAQDNGETLPAASATGPTTLNGVVLVDGSGDPNSQENVNVATLTKRKTGPFGCIHGAVGETEIVSSGAFGCALQEWQGMTSYHGNRTVCTGGGSPPYIAIRSDGYTQLSGNTGAVGLGNVVAKDADGNPVTRTGAAMLGKDTGVVDDPNNTYDPAKADNVRAAIHLSPPSDNSTGAAYMGTVRQETASGTTRDRAGASVQVDSTGNVVFTLPPSTTAVVDGELDEAHDHGLGIAFPQPDLAHTKYELNSALGTQY